MPSRPLSNVVPLSPSPTDALPSPRPEYVKALGDRGFELRECVGAGAFGVVYRAAQRSLASRDVAVKFYEGTRRAMPAHRERFEREAELLARLEHYAIPYILTAGVVTTNDGPVPYHVMQYLRGTRLSNLLESGGRRSVPEALRIIRPVLSALRHAHRRSIVHRDVAPDNIIVADDLSLSYLVDFSIGVSVLYEPGLTRVTQFGERVGRAAYAAPEQQQDSSNVDYRVDIYAAGVILFEMLTGDRTPRDVANDERIGVAALRTVIAKACAPDPDARHQSAVEFLNALTSTIGTIAAPGSAALALCPSKTCSSAVWSDRGYFKGPRVDDSTTANFCDACGTALLKACRSCRAPLPENLRELVLTYKAGPDRLQAFCRPCGALIFRSPTCGSCGSLLRAEDMNKNTSIEGCSKCIAKGRAPSNDGSDDIPF